ncbi:bifunctional diaminohydroxyphosphoribosylaminopyrimidine deaminase/5-amino-6-(5-phosphoribosylamino)uracil reductase RibD [Acidovorax sp.]|uniref:bifunctional diaminohydroxyphosphoribosylaminopyrimidine deaminase/5-amino-6-(5-phosphoribosylamino)uracil reductase RibD n=1 Tax=Acidovorax sp. TaxID=1872122 RepID=UPI0039196C00
MVNHDLSSESGLMDEALRLAREGLYRTSPNPRVGCVLVGREGKVIGRGSTQRAGGPHAEVMALRDAAQQGHAVAGSTAYVTLEPCSHHGRTGPCCDALVAAGVARVVASLPDPNPLVAGRGFARLRAAGVAVEVGLGRDESRELNLGFFSRMVRKTPWVRLKVAASLDGITALNNGASQWITGPEARADGHHWRAQASAILTGIGTVLADNPRLDVREVATPRQPHVVVVDSRMQLPADAALFHAERSVYIYSAIDNPPQRQALEARGAIVTLLPNPEGRVDLAGVLRDLAQKEINELHVEAGGILHGALIEQGLVDELIVYLAPKLLCAGRGMLVASPLSELSQAQGLRFQSVERVGEDLRVLARVAGRDEFA